MMLLACDGVTKTFTDPVSGTRVEAVRDLTFSVRQEEFVCIIGANGCGKTTLLHMIAGFERPTRGTIRVRGEEIDGPSPERGMVFQELSLFPWKTVAENVEFGLKVQGWNRKRRREITDEYLRIVGLGELGGARVHELSGGMQKKAAIARTLVMDPELLLMDEPFGAMDEQTRAQLDSELLRIWEHRRKTVVFVTHSIEEALMLADRILVLTPGPGTIGLEMRLDGSRPRDTFSPDMIDLRGRLSSELAVDRGAEARNTVRKSASGRIGPSRSIP